MSYCPPPVRTQSLSPLNTFLWWLSTVWWSWGRPCSQTHKIHGEKEAQTRWENTEAKAWLGSQHRLLVLLQLQSWLSWALSSVFGLDVRRGESALLASVCQLKVSLRWGHCQISRIIVLSHNLSPTSPFSGNRSQNMSCESVGRTKLQELAYISPRVAQSLLAWLGSWALNEGSTSLCVSKFFPWAQGQGAGTFQMTLDTHGWNPSSITDWLGVTLALSPWALRNKFSSSLKWKIVICSYEHKKSMHINITGL